MSKSRIRYFRKELPTYAEYSLVELTQIVNKFAEENKIDPSIVSIGADTEYGYYEEHYPMIVLSAQIEVKK